MTVSFRNNCSIKGFGEDYYLIRNFLVSIEDTNYSFGRWDWMVTHSYLDETGLSKIAVWEDCNEIVALVTYDLSLGMSFLLVKAEYDYLKEEMLTYAMAELAENKTFKVLITENDADFQDIATTMGFLPTNESEDVAHFPVDSDKLNYILPEGYSIQSLSENLDVYKYGKVLWNGFDHEANGEGKFNPSNDELEALEKELIRPNVNLDIKLAVVNSKGDFVSYCGMWQDPKSQYSIVEPVATDPAYRRLGLGRAAVLEGIKRCAALGSRTALVGSNQEFYYSIGFKPYSKSTWWERKN